MSDVARGPLVFFFREVLSETKQRRTGKSVSTTPTGRKKPSPNTHGPLTLPTSKQISLMKITHLVIYRPRIEKYTFTDLIFS